MRIMTRNTALLAASIMFITSCCQTCGRSPTQMASNIIQRQNVTTITHQTFPAKNPQTVALYTKESAPHTAYRVIGMATVSKKNLLGVERQDETVHSMMKNLAASIGGDGLIDVGQSGDDVQGKVIAYQKILI